MKRYTWLFCLISVASMMGCSSEQEFCFDGAMRCDKDKNAVVACSNGEWNIVQNCNDGKICVVDACVEGAETCQLEDKNSCEENVLKTCKDGVWVEDDCSKKGLVCYTDENTEPACKTCRTGDVSCMDEKFYRCNDGVWVFDEGCSGKKCVIGENGPECVSVCNSGETKCENNKLYICGDNQWDSGTECETGMICDKSGKNCELECEAGDTKCEGNTLYTCGENGWGEGESCNDKYCSDDGSGGKICRECMNGETKCADNVLQKCENGKFVTGQDCSKSAEYCFVISDVTAVCQHDCVAGQVKCAENDATSNEKFECENGKWSDTPTTCDAKRGCGKKVNENSELVDVCYECSENETKCGTDTDLDQNVLYYCNDKFWKADKNCADSDAVCVIGDDDKHFCKECEEGESKCDSAMNAVIFCKNGRFDIQPDDENLQKCSDESGKTEVCIEETDGDKLIGKCRGTCTQNACVVEEGISKLAVCKNGVYENPVQCNDKDICVEQLDEEGGDVKAQCFECESGTTKCSDDGSGVIECVLGKWAVDIPKESCTEKNMMCAVLEQGAACKEKCVDGQKKCFDNKAFECTKDGNYKFSTNCETECKEISTGTETVTDAYCRECVDDTHQCNVKDGDKNDLYVCVNGKWVGANDGESSLCQEGTVCRLDDNAEKIDYACLENCTPNTSICGSDGHVYTCDANGVYIDDGACSGEGQACAMVCEGKDCLENEAKKAKCVVCNPDANGTKCSDDRVNVMYCADNGNWAKNGDCKLPEYCGLVDNVAQCVRCEGNSVECFAGGVLSSCIDGQISATACREEEVSCGFGKNGEVENKCRKLVDAANGAYCKDNVASKCDNKEFISCVNGKVERKSCVDILRDKCKLTEFDNEGLSLNKCNRDKCEIETCHPNNDSAYRIVKTEGKYYVSKGSYFGKDDILIKKSDNTIDITLERFGEVENVYLDRDRKRTVYEVYYLIDGKVEIGYINKDRLVCNSCTAP